MIHFQNIIQEIKKYAIQYSKQTCAFCRAIQGILQMLFCP